MFKSVRSIPSLRPIRSTKTVVRLNCTRSMASMSHTPVPTKIRNIGIIAHIDAGKTTTTERMLYYSGFTNRIGNVDQGDTVMDYLPAERDRGITITSAAITFNWGGYKMNLIDTPGHADFTFEVIRSIRVLDGAVTVLDGVAGVEAQTEKVWKQANNIPKIVFVNKMDRAGAGFGRTVKEVVAKLNTKVGVVNIPFFKGASDFRGVVDVIDQKAIEWKENSDGKEVLVTDIGSLGPEYIQEVIEARTALVETLCEFDQALVDEYLDTEDYMQVSAASIKRALRNASLNNHITPVLCGASFRNIGVQPLLQAVVDYLPSPQERPAPHAITKMLPAAKNKRKVNVQTRKVEEQEVIIDPTSKELTCALAFKVVNDPMRGILVFVRVYSGQLQQNTVVLNTSNGKKERISRLLQMQADESIEVKNVERGNIAVIVGSKEIRTGDTIVAHAAKKDGVNHLQERDKTIHLQPIKIPPPVFFASIEPQTLSDKRGMEHALDVLMREDPSLHLTYDYDSDQTLLSGMGELHLEIAKGRLIKDLKAKVEMGGIQVSYKETIQITSKEFEKTVELDDSEASSATVRLHLEPVTSDDFEGEQLDHDNNYVTYPVDNEQQQHPFISHLEICNAARIGAIPAFARGGKVAFLPLHSVRIIIDSIDIPEDVTSPNAISSAVRLAAEEALESINKTSYSIMEPIMDVRVILNEEDIGTVVNDITGTRRGHIVSLGEEDVSSQTDSVYKEIADDTWIPKDHTMHLSKHDERVSSLQSVVHARVALAKMIGYLPHLRSMTQGRGTYLLDFYQYEQCAPDRQQEVIESI